MKSVLLSVKPQHVANILNGIKTIEVRKRFPKDYVGWVYIYCTKDNELLCQIDNEWNTIKVVRGAKLKSIYNGKVVARFWCDKVETIHSYLEPEQWYMTSDLGGSGLLEKSCLSFKELDDYLLSGEGYAIHITKLEIFEEPKELNEFWYCTEKHCIFSECHKYMHCRKYLKRPPQSWQYVEVDL